MVVFIPFLVIILVMVVFVVLVQVGQICVFGKCFYIISPQFQNELNFWMLVILFIALQVAFIYLYIKLGSFALKGFSFAKNKYATFIEYAKRIFTRVS